MFKSLGTLLIMILFEYCILLVIKFIGDETIYFISELLFEFSSNISKFIISDVLFLINNAHMFGITEFGTKVIFSFICNGLLIFIIGLGLYAPKLLSLCRKIYIYRSNDVFLFGLIILLVFVYLIFNRYALLFCTLPIKTKSKKKFSLLIKIWEPIKKKGSNSLISNTSDVSLSINACSNSI